MEERHDRGPAAKEREEREAQWQRVQELLERTKSFLEEARRNPSAVLSSGDRKDLLRALRHLDPERRDSA